MTPRSPDQWPPHGPINPPDKPQKSEPAPDRGTLEREERAREAERERMASFDRYLDKEFGRVKDDLGLRPPPPPPGGLPPRDPRLEQRQQDNRVSRADMLRTAVQSLSASFPEAPKAAPDGPARREELRKQLEAMGLSRDNIEVALTLGISNAESAGAALAREQAEKAKGIDNAAREKRMRGPEKGPERGIERGRGD